MTNTVTYHLGDVRDVMAAMPDASVDCLVTSPPFLALRSYLPDDHEDKHREIGGEPTPAEFMATLLGLTGEWRRLVAPWGSVCVELGDTMSGSGGSGGDYAEDGTRAGQPRVAGSAMFRDGYVRNDRPGRPPQDAPKSYPGGRTSPGKRVGPRDAKHNRGGNDDAVRSRAAQKRDVIEGWPLGKSLCLIPELYAVGLAYGLNPLTGIESPAGLWRVRNWMPWTRPNPPVGSLGKINTELVTGDQRFRQGSSFVTVACTGRHRWFDLEAVRTLNPRVEQDPGGYRMVGGEPTHDAGPRQQNPGGAPPLDWWDANDLSDDELDEHWRLDELLADEWQPFHRMSSQPYKGSHYAAFPVALPRRLVAAMCPLEVCRTCGRPRLRRVEVKRLFDGEPTELPVGRRGNGAPASGVGNWRVTRSAETAGWTDCGHGDYRPGVAFDPFGGSGTTAVAAAQVGRDSVLVDLDARNVDLCRRRLTESMLVLDERRVGDAFVWTVDPALPGVEGRAPGAAVAVRLAPASCTNSHARHETPSVLFVTVVIILL